jgi:hypothetical protein
MSWPVHNPENALGKHVRSELVACAWCHDHLGGGVLLRLCPRRGVPEHRSLSTEDFERVAEPFLRSH